MKHFLYLSAFLFSSLAYSQSLKYELKDLHGSWIDTLDVDGRNGFVFLQDSSWMFIKDGRSVGGKDWKDRDRQASNTFTADFNSYPMTLDLLVTYKSTNDQKTALAIFEFINLNLIRVAIEFDGTRPKDYPEEYRQTAILRRVIEN